MAATTTRVLLQNAFVPAHYAVALEPDLVRFVFDGSVDISGTMQAASKSIRLHAKELLIPSATYTTKADKKSFKASHINFDIKATTVEFVFAEEIPAGDGVFTVPFVGTLNNQMAGFYRSSYTDVNGAKKTMASTQFEPLDARRALPCVDEPAVKATFGVTFTVASHLTAFSNMPEQETTLLAGGKKRITFMDSPKMSTYLLAFVVGEFDFVQCLSDHGVVIRVYTPPGKAETGVFSMECAKKALDYYDDFFAIPYPLPKLDMVGIPEFAMGAMENWGLVTYREVDMLIDPKTASPQQRERVCTVVAHELAHQWFGNLVTMAWWSDLWLNEGFATFMQNLATDLVFPEWKMWDQFGVDILGGALNLDSLRSSHPIQVPIAHAEEVESVFDAISYLKGASVNRMLYSVLGADAFKAGLQLYMARHKYDNTETIDLWTALAEASKQDVKSVMASWTEQMGYPLVKVVDATTSGDKLVLKLQQSWFLADGSEGDGRKWVIPIITSVGGVEQPITFMRDADATIEVPAAGGWVKINSNQTVPCRVQYTPDLLQRLAGGVADKTLPAADRAGLLLDSYALAKAGLLDPAEVVRLLAAYKAEDNVTVWSALSGVLQGLDKLLVGGSPALHAAYLKFVAQLIAAPAAAVGWIPQPSDGHRGKLLRATLIGLIGRFSQRAEDIAEARSRFDAIVANPSDPAACPSEYRTSVYQAVLRRFGATEYAKARKLFETASSDADRKQVLLAVGYSEAHHLETLDWATSGAVKLQDFFYPMMSVSASSKAGLETTWQYFQTNFARLQGMLATASPSLMDAVISCACAGFTTAARADEVAAFFKAHPVPANERRVAQVLEGIRVNAAFNARIEASSLGQEAFWAGLSA